MPSTSTDPSVTAVDSATVRRTVNGCANSVTTTGNPARLSRQATPVARSPPPRIRQSSSVTALQADHLGQVVRAQFHGGFAHLVGDLGHREALSFNDGDVEVAQFPAKLPEAATEYLRKMECDLIDEDDVREQWLTTLADTACPGPIRDEIRSLVAGAQEERL